MQIALVTPVLDDVDLDNVTSPFLMFWFVREVLWWCLVGFLLALLGRTVPPRMGSPDRLLKTAR